ncbi:pyridoxamine 5'-phosphate oxidase family protein [Streptomyces sp. NPDC058372]|uniref:pyridoxamine 5'-phosphate oxidase family protein n=1 Tax=unclassified Streptomyces TaxID=2593676 RepID=UPI00366400CF
MATPQESPRTRDERSESTPSDQTPAGGAYVPTPRTVPTRSRERASYDRAAVHAILDEGAVCHLGFVRDGAPVVLPTLYTRIGESLYVHGSTGSPPLRSAGGEEGLPVCVTVTHLDALVLARSAFNHSLNYRSVVALGTAYQVTDPAEKAAALDALVEQVVPGRAADCRPADAKELAATAVLRLELAEVSAKSRTGDPGDDPEDMTLPHWAGLVPVETRYGAPVRAGDLDAEVPLPGYLASSG